MTLRDDLIKLAYHNEAVRPHILPLLKTASKVLKKFPSNTEFKATSMHWGVWGGQLATVSGPMYDRAAAPAEAWQFDVNNRARIYKVRFAVDMNGKRLKPPNRECIGEEVRARGGSRVQGDPNYLWSIRTGSGFTDYVEGRWEKKVEEFRVQIKMKDLHPKEIAALVKNWESEGWVDISQMKTKFKAADLKKLMKAKDWDDVQKLNDVQQALASDILEEAYYVFGNRSDETLWNAMNGVFRISSRGKLQVAAPKGYHNSP